MKTENIIVFCVVVAAALWMTNCSRQHTANDATVTNDSSAQTSNTSPERLFTYEQRQGKVLYTKYCAVCHGDEGKGDGFNSYNLDPKPRDFTDAKYMNNLTDERIAQTIIGGGRSVNRSPLMPSWGGRIPKEEIRYLVAYVHVFGSPKQSAESK